MGVVEVVERAFAALSRGRMDVFDGKRVIDRYLAWF